MAIRKLKFSHFLYLKVIGKQRCKGLVIPPHPTLDLGEVPPSKWVVAQAQPQVVFNSIQSITRILMSYVHYLL